MKLNKQFIFRIMRLSFIQLLLFVGFINLSISAPLKGQDLLEKKVSVALKDVSLGYAIKELEKEGKVRFSYNSRSIDFSRKINLISQNESLKITLEKLLNPLNIDFFQVDNQIVLRLKQIPTNPKETINSITMVMEVNSNKQVAETVSGKVLNENGEPLPGATVRLVGTTIGVTTDINGEFSIEANENDRIEISFVGYLKQIILIGNQTKITVNLSIGAKNLEEVVVTGYSSTSKRALTGAISKIDTKDLALSSSTNLSKALQGTAPGLVIRQGSPQPGFDNNPIYIRGTGTFNNSEALVVIDGVPDRQGGLSRLTSEEIESISVIKDATAAIYGSRSANGVLVVTTKKGKSGKPKINYSNSYSYDKPIFLPKTLNKIDYVTWQKEAADYLGGTTYKPYTAEGLNAYKTGNTDGYIYPDGETVSDIIFDPNYWAPRNKHNLSFEGGNEYTKYFLSTSLINQSSSLKSDISKFNQKNVRMNLEQKVGKFLTLSANILARKESNVLWPGGDPQFLSTPQNTPNMLGRLLMNVYLSGPLAQAYWPNGKKSSSGALIDQIKGKGGQVNSSDLYLQSNFDATVSIPSIEGLKIKGTVAYDNFYSYLKKLTKPIEVYNLASGATDETGLVKGTLGKDINLAQYSTIGTNKLYQGILTYEKKFKDHGFNFLIGLSREESNNQNFWTFRSNLISALTDVLSQGQVGTEKNDGSEFSVARMNYFGNLNYNFKERYFLQILSRYDGSYLFPSNSRYGFFPGVSGGWIISDEKFMENSPFSFLKLRGSYGKLGNDNVPPNQFISSFNSGVWFVDGKTTQTLNETKVANPFITWEVAENLDYGVEGSLFNNKLSFEIQHFKSSRNNILTKPYGSVADITGIVPPFENIGKTVNKGWEYTLGYKTNIGDFKLNTTAFISTNNNTLIFADEPKGLDPAISREGRRIGSWKYWEVLGVFQNQSQIDANKIDYTPVGNGTLRPGDLILKDVNGDGKINTYDYQFTNGSIIPKIISSLNIQISYRKFDATMKFYGTFGGYLDQPYGFNNGFITQYVFDNRWTKEGDKTEFGRANNRQGGNPYTGLMVAKTDHVKLQYLEIGYNIDSDALNKIIPNNAINNIRLFVNANDFFFKTFDKKLWSHPEAFVGDVDNGSGVFVPLNPTQSLLTNSNLSYANKSFTFGVNVKF